ncbi:MAG: hypothetical protein ACXQT4_04805 [Methanotrichaceae archaeon]
MAIKHSGGQGVGGPRRHVGGTSVCVCPKCGLEIPHMKGIPCIERRCPKCGVKMVGK